jgi:hypothetical protein
MELLVKISQGLAMGNTSATTKSRGGSFPPGPLTYKKNRNSFPDSRFRFDYPLMPNRFSAVKFVGERIKNLRSLFYDERQF